MAEPRQSPPQLDSDGIEVNEKLRLDRNLGELLQELRVAVPGVTVLLGFLLAVPFQARFALVNDFQEAIYFLTLLLTALATVLLVAPTAYHRLTFRRQLKDQLVPFANRLAIVGLVALGLSITGVIVLVTDFIYGPATTILTGTACGALFIVLWLMFPLTARLEAEREDDHR